jgi:hemerythrin
MPFFNWNQAYSVGIVEIDIQHKKLFDLINKLYEAMQVGQGSKQIGNVVAELIAYAGTHFSVEEKYMATHKYPDLGKHKAVHDAFVQKVLEFQRQYLSGKMAMSIDILNFLKDWLVTHIQVEDQKYAPYLKNKGMA